VSAEHLASGSQNLTGLANRRSHSSANPNRDNYRWHYALDVNRALGGINPPMVSIRFPRTGLGGSRTGSAPNSPTRRPTLRLVRPPGGNDGRRQPHPGYHRPWPDGPDPTRCDRRQRGREAEHDPEDVALLRAAQAGASG
jgi:hypothetical protein